MRQRSFPQTGIEKYIFPRIQIGLARAFLTLVCASAIAGHAAPTEIQFLSGTDKDNTVPWDFQVSTGRNAGIATNIAVPSCWELKGFGTYQYGSTSRSNSETGFYKHTFAVPPAWAGKKIFLVFEGAFTDTSASINGQSVGPTHQGGYYEFKYDVTTNVVVGANTNVLAVTVRKWSASVNLTRSESLGNDYWLFGGIYRPVYLEAKPAAHVERIAANPLASGQVTVNAHLGGISNNYTVRAFVTGTNNVRLGHAFSNSVPMGATEVTLSASLPTPEPWSAEFPNLYTLQVELIDANHTVIHSVSETIGFRTITYNKGQGFFVNGRKVVMRGICRHEEWPTSGRTTSRALSIMDIKLMKEANFNAVRMSHYPPNKIFLEECDRLGMYVLHEFASYQHGGDQGGNGPMDIPNGSRLIGELIRRDVNHPCVFAWGNGNESGANPHLDGGAEGSTNYFALHDIQNRLVIRPQQGGQVFNNVATDHYENYFGGRTSVSNYLRAGATSVFMPTEMLHGLYDGGGGACLAEMWELFRTAPNSGGLFLWAWNDSGIQHDDTGVMDVSGSNGPDGIVGPFREKEASYYAVKSVFSPVQVTPPDPATAGTPLVISNRFDFTDLNQCTFDWQLGWFPQVTDSADKFSTNALTGGLLIAEESRNFTVASVPPQTRGLLALPSFPRNWTNYDALRLTATDPFGNHIYTWTWPLRSPAQIRDRILGVAGAGSPGISAGTNASEIIVTNGPRVFRFSKTSGVINNVTVSNQPVSFSNGPRPVADSPWPVTGITNYFDGTHYVIAVNDLDNSTNAFQWSLRPDGWMKLTYRYTLTGLHENIGITFDYPSHNVTALDWLGQGPYRVWKNRLAGQEIFAHTKSYNDVWTGQSTHYSARRGTETETQWTYPEFAGHHGQLYWATLRTTEQPITVVTPTTNLFFRVLTPPATDIRNVNPAFPPGNISLLHGISGIGTKTVLAARLGPSAETNVAAGLYTGEADFFFGPPPPSGTGREGNVLR
ncbi:MAG: glycoside hydrolase family 2 [Akkermansiaceae bacterium]|nr:glycoside hydrolase family 2 [Verrucomicrobiales bacterium]